jgi:hypothetical protein
MVASGEAQTLIHDCQAAFLVPVSLPSSRRLRRFQVPEVPVLLSPEDFPPGMLSQLINRHRWPSSSAGALGSVRHVESLLKRDTESCRQGSYPKTPTASMSGVTVHVLVHMGRIQCTQLHVGLWTFSYSFTTTSPATSRRVAVGNRRDYFHRL